MMRPPGLMNNDAASDGRGRFFWVGHSGKSLKRRQFRWAIFRRTGFLAFTRLGIVFQDRQVIQMQWLGGKRRRIESAFLVKSAPCGGENEAGVFVKATFSRADNPAHVKTLPPPRAWTCSEFAREKLGFEGDEKQRMVLDSTAKTGILNCSRQWGKSTVMAVKAVHRAWTRRNVW